MSDGFEPLFALALGAGLKSSFLYWLYGKRAAYNHSFVRVGQVAGLVIYPFKGAEGIEFDEVRLTNHGAQNGCVKDRNWAAIDTKTRKYIATSNWPSMAIIKPSFHDNFLHLDAPGMETLTIPITMTTAQKCVCNILGQEFETVDCGDNAADWFSRYLKRPNGSCRVVSTSPLVRQRKLYGFQKVFVNRSRPHDEVTLTNFSQYLMVSQASLDDINSRAPVNSSAANMRNNITVDGCGPYAEDYWTSVRFGGESGPVLFKLRSCTRCPVITVDPETGIKHQSEEPLRTLKKYRQRPEIKGAAISPMFGVQLSVDNCGPVRVGDSVYAIVGEVN